MFSEMRADKREVGSSTLPRPILPIPPPRYRRFVGPLEALFTPPFLKHHAAYCQSAGGAGNDDEEHDLVSYPEAARRRMDFIERVREDQCRFRESSHTISDAARRPTDEMGRKHCHLLALGHEEENLYPPLRGRGGATDFFAARKIHWWRSTSSGDGEGGSGPTRNLTSSQVACVNFLMPLQSHPEVFTSLLRGLGDEVDELVPIQYNGPAGAQLSSLVDFEFAGIGQTLEGGVFSRGAHATSADAVMIGRSGPITRAYLIEWKYAEQYVGAEAKTPAKRLNRYQERYGGEDGCFNGCLPLEALLYDPVYQLVRLGLLGDKLRRERHLPVDQVRVVVVCPEDNLAYRNTVTPPALAALNPKPSSLVDAARRLWREPSNLIMTSPRNLLNCARASLPAELAPWADYISARYLG